MIFADGLMKNQVTLVTGGGTGIGHGISPHFAWRGADLIRASHESHAYSRTPK